jgi:hypothetical protein
MPNFMMCVDFQIYMQYHLKLATDKLMPCICTYSFTNVMPIKNSESPIICHDLHMKCSMLIIVFNYNTKVKIAYCDIFRLSAVVARQQELKHVFVDTLDSPTVLDRCGNRMEHSNCGMGSAFCWGSQVLYKEDTTQKTVGS